MIHAGKFVTIQGFPVPQDPYNRFDYNGKVGTVKQAMRTGFGLNNEPAYAYEVFFKDVNVLHTSLNQETRQLIRETKVEDALGWFDEAYVREVTA